MFYLLLTNESTPQPMQTLEDAVLKVQNTLAWERIYTKTIEDVTFCFKSSADRKALTQENASGNPRIVSLELNSDQKVPDIKSIPHYGNEPVRIPIEDKLRTPTELG